MRAYLFLLALLPSLSAFAGAKDDMKACSDSSDCAVAEDYCGNARPLNKKFLKQNEKANLGFQTLMQCPDGSSSKAHLFEAVCTAKQCELKAKELPVKDSVPSA
ncbi:MAG: hypothetical protein EOP11_13130 [Proteobacteria bacterium]|nr:MAG: hypothetical protein EOP11_13130 [Pseudomonadota bacterium]